MNWFKSSYSSSGDGDCVEVALNWRKSTYSSGSGDNCIEVAESWHKSSYSSASGDNCIEVATTPATIHIRDSKTKQGPQLALAPTTWSVFVAYAAKAEPQD
ncbi:toxin [Streptomyces sp. S816]|uniref:DUF397 domain-containing protein n=1 Tax=Streptomyces sp. S816 TaxID=2283197 RepID=UPI00109C1E14|nr:DUF397 domain-containing protein [Streptomyces sp. S816]TGZ18276.1 toxin [Streptomyces sp. S816]